MTIKAFYNEIDPYCCAWLSNLMDAGHITPGVICDRSIEDLRPSDVRGYDRVHFFAGIGVWDYALNLAGWGSRPVWSGSCPCQPFSAAGKGSGFDDERHLWPHFHWLITQCRPAVVLGEQVASKDGLAWLDLVQADLEGAGYTSGAVDTCAAGFGAPHIRQRLYWVAYADDPRPQGRRGMSERADQCAFGQGGMVGGLANAGSERVRAEGLGTAATTPVGMCAADGQWERLWVDAGTSSTNGADRLANSDSNGSQPWRESAEAVGQGDSTDTDGGAYNPGPVNGFWADADWLFCRDGKWRPVEPGVEPLADGAPARVGRLRGYGNAINAIQAQAFIETVMELTT